MRNSTLWHIALAIFLIAGVARWTRPTGEPVWNNCGIRVGEPAAALPPGRRDVCGSYVVSMTANCPDGNWLDGENSDYVRTFKGMRVEIRCHSLTQGSIQLRVGMDVAEAESVMGRKPDQVYRSEISDTLQLFCFETSDAVVGISVDGSKVTSLLLIQKFHCPLSETHRCGYYHNWWHDHLKGWIGSSPDNPWPNRKPDSH